MTFIVYALPRSRTYWLSQFLSYGGWHTYHDAAMYLSVPADLKAWATQPMTGCVETAASPFWRAIGRVAPTMKVAVIRRPVEEAIESLKACGVAPDVALLHRLDCKLRQISARVPGALTLRYDELNEDGCARLFEHCLGLPHDPQWYAGLAKQNLQVDLPAQFRFAQAFSARFAKLEQQLKQAELAALSDRRRPVSGEITYSVEPFRAAFEEAEPLLRGHMLVTEQSIGGYREKDHRLMEALDRLGFLQTSVARCNGRMVGYLLTLFGPNIDEAGSYGAQHSAMYADPAFAGVGLKMLRFADEQLKAKNVGQVIGRAGHRGSGPRMGVLWRRLGYADFGQMYHRDLREAV